MQSGADGTCLLGDVLVLQQKSLVGFENKKCHAINSMFLFD